MSAGYLQTLDGTIVYPAYMAQEEREALKKKISRSENPDTYMWCSCRSDEKLYYGISSDQRFYPLHKGYEHKDTCPRYANRRTYGYTTSDSGEPKAFLSFSPVNFSYPKEKEETVTENSETTKESTQKETEEKKEATEKGKSKEKKDKPDASLSLDALIKELNFDTYMSRHAQGKQAVLSRDYFTSAVSGRAKYVVVGGTQTKLRDFNLKEHGCRFVYSNVQDIRKADTAYYVTIKGWKSSFSYYTPKLIMEQELLRFWMRMGMGEEEEEEQTAILRDLIKKGSLMAAGFIYRRVSRAGKPYLVFGRPHLFLTSENGLYCENLLQVQIYDTILKTVTADLRARNPKGIHMYLPNQNERYLAVMAAGGNRIEVYEGNTSKKDEKKTICCKGQPLSEQVLMDEIRNSLLPE